MKTDRRGNSVQKMFETVRYVFFRCLRVVLFFAFIKAFLPFSFTMVEGSLRKLQEHWLVPILLWLFHVLFFAIAVYSAARILALYDGECAARYEKDRTFVRKWEFWFFLGGVFWLQILFPFPFFASSLLLGQKAVSLLGSVLLFVCMAPFVFWAFLSAEKYRKKLGKRAGGLGTYMPRLFFLASIYFLSHVVFALAIGFFVTGVYLLETRHLKFFLAVVAVLALLWVPRYIRAWRKRRKFIRSLKALAEKEGYELSPIKRPFSSILKDFDGASFEVKAHGKKYICKLYSSLNRKNAVTFGEGGEAVREYTFRVGRGIRSVEVFTLRSHFDYSVEGDGIKVIIFTNLPIRVSVHFKGKIAPCDNGDSISDYRIYGGTPFLACLERDTVEKAVK